MYNTNGEFKYSDIINEKRPVSAKHPPMPMDKRAAQFSPFAALTGYEDSIDSARLLFFEENAKSGEYRDDLPDDI
ncbi:hypothetical protein [Butyrivibrio sp. MC2013]|uniref:hypothetical protein n=1 Tax=Butyrivibrio sp. MC2013 TaxID=1280686 RepID=UPI00041DF995|nr:hypothetical protein [Butyrivibrio sp. MC2013]